ncbi:MAG: beta strand repeat-containing protein, partial [Ignavibacteria bacterium]
MKAKLRMLIWVIALAMTLPLQLQSQIPMKLSYQGLLLMDKDTPYPDSSYSITFRMYDANQSGNQLWTETQTLTTINGVFDAILGQVNPLNLPFDKQYWLGITVGSDPEFSPRVQLVSSPYSLRSDSAKFAVKADTANYVRGLTYDATGAVLSINGKQGKLFITGGKGVLIGGGADTVLIEIAPGVSTITSTDSTISIRKSADSIDLSIANNAINSIHIRNNAITNAKLADSSITGNKISSMGAFIGQVLKWNGTTWAPANDNGDIYTAGKGIAITGNVISNTGDADSTNDITIGSKAGGDLSGTFPNPDIGNGKVTNSKIADGAITASKLDRMSAGQGQVMKWNGTAWVASDDIGKNYKAGVGISISMDTIINTGDANGLDDITVGSIAGGDLSGFYPNPLIGQEKVTTGKLANQAVTNQKLADTSITATKLGRMNANIGQVMKWNGTTWIASDDIGFTYKAGKGILISNDTIINTGTGDSVKVYYPGRGIAISNDSIINTILIDTNTLITKNRISANGEVLGKFDSLYIKDGVITAAKLNNMGATTGQVLKWNGTAWQAQKDSVKLYFPGQGIAISNDTIINTGGSVDTNNLITKNRISANGEVLGKFDSLYIKNGVVTTIKLADTSVTAAKLNRMGANTGQVLKWNGTAWQAQNDSVKLYFPGQGIAISNDTIINTGGSVDTNNLITKNRISANGEVLGKFDSLYIKDGAVRTAKLADSSVTAAKLNRMGANTGQILKWNGTAWQAQNDSVKLYFPGQGIAISNDTIINTSTVDTNNLITKNRISANGEVLGKFDSLYIKDGVVSTIKLANNAVTTAKLADTSVTAAKLNRMGATTGQVLKWSGTAWQAQNDSVKLYFPGQGIAISNDTIINTSTVDTNNLITKNRISANGEVLGKFDSLYIKDGVVTTIKLANNAVTTIKLADTSVTAAKLNRMGATTGQVLKWNGTTWQAQNDSVKLYFPGQGIAISNDTIINTSTVDTNNLITKNRISANGEVLGKFDSLYIKDGVVTTIKLANNSVTTAKLADTSVTAAKLNRMGATTGHVLKWNGTAWQAQNDSVKLYFPGQGIAISNDTIINTSTVDTNNLITKNRISANGEVLGKFDSLYIKDGVVSTIKLANNAVTTA